MNSQVAPIFSNFIYDYYPEGKALAMEVSAIPGRQWGTITR